MIQITNEIYNIIANTPTPASAERDYLECNILSELFRNPYMFENCVLAGGVSLSKSYRFSHRLCNDVDLACSDFIELTPYRSRKDLQRFKRKFKGFVFHELFNQVCEVINDDNKFKILNDRQFLDIQGKYNVESFPVLHILSNSRYGAPCHICLEIVARKYSPAMISARSVIPYYLPQYPVGKIPTVSYVQTFWDKVYALHANAGSNHPRTEGFISRHFYDLAQMAPSIDLSCTFENLLDVALHRAIYTTRNVPLIVEPADVNIIPAKTVLGKIEADYNIYAPVQMGVVRPWSEIISIVQALNKQIRSL